MDRQDIQDQKKSIFSAILLILNIHVPSGEFQTFLRSAIPFVLPGGRQRMNRFRSKETGQASKLPEVSSHEAKVKSRCLKLW